MREIRVQWLLAFTRRRTASRLMAACGSRIRLRTGATLKSSLRLAARLPVQGSIGLKNVRLSEAALCLGSTGITSSSEQDRVCATKPHHWPAQSQ